MIILFFYVQKLEQGEENCEGVGEEECFLIRRTLAAHTDYIYTQNQYNQKQQLIHDEIHHTMVCNSDREEK